MSTNRIPSIGWAALLAFAPLPAVAQAPGECSSGFCGTPDMSGGGGGGGGGGAILIANTDLGETYSTSDDFDQDGFEDDLDNCPFTANTGQFDRDGDGFGDVCDNAKDTSNPDQLDTDGDGAGDVADDDIDGDGLANATDTCARVANPAQIDTDGDRAGDACDADDDGDGLSDIHDQCPKLPGTIDPSTQACRGDEDLDNISDEFDNCAGASNTDQKDADGDGLGDACDVDLDGDSVLNNLDNARAVANPDQLDRDRDGLGDVADPEYCYVFSRARPDACLNPLDTFKVGALAMARGTSELVTGTDLHLVLFANRVDVPIEYRWSVEARPRRSESTVSGAIGRVDTSSGAFEYRYAEVAPVFTPDRPGEYALRLEARLLLEDGTFPGGPRVATTQVALTVAGEEPGGCSASGTGSLSPSLVLAACVFLARRRRR